jgi:hypothetical protein
MVRKHTGIGVPIIVVDDGTFLFAGELLIDDFFELDHVGGNMYMNAIGVIMGGRWEVVWIEGELSFGGLTLRSCLR